MTNMYYVTGTLIAPGPFVGEARLWVDTAVWPARTAHEAAALALTQVCEAEALAPRTAVWGTDLQVREVGLELRLADEHWFRWAQHTVAARHYLHAPVDPRSSPLVYIIAAGSDAVGCLIFGRPESTRCYDGKLTYGGLGDVAQGRAKYSRWEVINLARVWLDPIVQRGGKAYTPKAASTAIRMALRRVTMDYLIRYPPCFIEEPWMLQRVISYCDTRIHTGYLYHAARFHRVRVNAAGVETYARALRPLSADEQELIARLSAQSARSRRYRSTRSIDAHQEALL